jgi:glycosyltransferase involved in cell wall biosynthesis
MNELITFIIPTIGRDTLSKSIYSLINQTKNKWHAIVIFDGIKNNIIDNTILLDKRIKFIELDEKKGNGINSAGLVRNHGMALVKTTWIAFLDDDDTLSHNYIETFYKEYELYPNIDVLIFRMKLENRIVPKIGCTNFELCDVGISFAMKTSIFQDHGFCFVSDGAEDYLFLDKIRSNGYNMMISPYVTYFVKQEWSNESLGNRVFINTEKNNLLAFWAYLMIYKNFS